MNVFIIVGGEGEEGGDMITGIREVMVFVNGGGKRRLGVV